MGAKPGTGDKWSSLELERLIFLREDQKMTFAAIAEDLKKPLQSCYRRYTQIIESRAPSIVPIIPMPKAFTLHGELGIRTVQHFQATTDYRGGFDRDTGEYWSPHLFREKITLSGGFV